MRPYFLKTSAAAALLLLLHFNGSAQEIKPDEPTDKKDTAGRMSDYDEIVIKRKSDKDSKVTVEIKDNQVFINGKPVTDFEDDNVAVRIKTRRAVDGWNFSSLGDLQMPEPGEPRLAPPTIFRDDQGPAINMQRDMVIAGTNRAMLGVMSESGEKEGKEGGGAWVKAVTKGSAAEKAGLKPGDVITKVDEIAITSPNDLSDAVHQYKPKDKIVLTFTRDGKSQKATATLGEGRNIRVSRTYGPDTNAQLYNLDRANREFNFNYDYPYITMDGNSPKLGIKAQDTEDGKGVKVLGVADESPAAKAGIKAGDIITRFDGRSVDDANMLKMLALSKRAQPGIKVSILRDGKAMDLDVKIPKKLKSADL